MVTQMSERPPLVCLPPLLESAATLRRMLGAALDALGAGAEEAADMVLAASEAFNNAVCHGSMRGSDSLWLGIEAADRELVVTLEYRGEPFAASAPALPEADQPHGRGRYLMQRLTDSVAYAFDQNWTRIELRKRVRGE